MVKGCCRSCHEPSGKKTHLWPRQLRSVHRGHILLVSRSIRLFVDARSWPTGALIKIRRQKKMIKNVGCIRIWLVDVGGCSGGGGSNLGNYSHLRPWRWSQMSVTDGMYPSRGCMGRLQVAAGQCVANIRTIILVGAGHPWRDIDIFFW
jgi:hypothetical protein